MLTARLTPGFAMMATLLVGCAHAPPRMAAVDVGAWADAQPAPGVSRVAAERYEALRPRVQSLAEKERLNLVVDRNQVVYAAPDLDLTAALLGKGGGAARAGERTAFVDLQRVIDHALDAQHAKALLKAEFERKQAELDGLQQALKDKYGNDVHTAVYSAEAAALRARFAELQHELSQHEADAVHTVLEQLKPDCDELGRRHAVDVIFETSVKGGAIIYRRDVAFPPRGPDLTDELIALHNQRIR